MYADGGPLFPYFQSFSIDVPHLEEFYWIQKYNERSNMVQSSAVSEYDLGGEGDLFKAPEPIIEESVMRVDPMTTAISMISIGEDVMSGQEIKVSDMEIQNERLLSEVFYEYEKDLLEKSAMDEALAAVPNVQIPALEIMEDPIREKNRSVSEGAVQKSASSACLSSIEWINGGGMRPNFLDFQQMNLEAAFGMRRAFSDGDIQLMNLEDAFGMRRAFSDGDMQTLGNERRLTIGNYTIEERRQRLCRYRKKKSKRNFNRKIKESFSR